MAGDLASPTPVEPELGGGDYVMSMMGEEGRGAPVSDIPKYDDSIIFEGTRHASWGMSWL